MNTARKGHVALNWRENKSLMTSCLQKQPARCQTNAWAIFISVLKATIMLRSSIGIRWALSISIYAYYIYIIVKLRVRVNKKRSKTQWDGEKVRQVLKRFNGQPPTQTYSTLVNNATHQLRGAIHEKLRPAQISRRTPRQPPLIQQPGFGR